jgi:hypothetical protein
MAGYKVPAPLHVRSRGGRTSNNHSQQGSKDLTEYETSPGSLAINSPLQICRTLDQLKHVRIKTDERLDLSGFSTDEQ